MESNALYKSLSARITAEVLGRDKEQWPSYFDDLRALVRRVVSEADESAKLQRVVEAARAIWR